MKPASRSLQHTFPPQTGLVPRGARPRKKSEILNRIEASSATTHAFIREQLRWSEAGGKAFLLYDDAKATFNHVFSPVLCVPNRSFLRRAHTGHSLQTLATSPYAKTARSPCLPASLAAFFILVSTFQHTSSHSSSCFAFDFRPIIKLVQHSLEKAIHEHYHNFIPCSFH